MTVLVTGGAGFIGLMVCRRLLERGHDVVVLDNFSFGRRDLIAKLRGDIRVVEADIRDVDAVKRVFAEVRPETVCHLAAIHFIPYCNAHPQEATATNVVGTLNVFEACKDNPPSMIVSASTAAVYGIGDGPHREDEPPGPMDIYGITKLAGEHLAILYTSQIGAPSTAARIFNAVGPDETNPHLVPALVGQLRSGATRVSLGNLEPYRDYIDTRDLADGLITLLERPGSGYNVFNLGTGREHSVRQIVGYCEQILGRTIEIEQRADLKRKVERMHLRASIERVTTATPWRPVVDIRETLKALLLE